MLSKITLGNYSHQRKVAQANQYWKDLCKEKKIFLIKFDKTVKAIHLNRLKLHLCKGDVNQFYTALMIV